VTPGRVITTAGVSTTPVKASRRDAVRLVREALFKPDATDDDRDDALEALVELSKE